MGTSPMLHWLVVVVMVALLVFVLRVPFRRRTRESSASIEARLRELQSLKTRGLVTDAEYEERQRAILRET